MGALWKRPETLQVQDECSPHMTPELLAELGSGRVWGLLGVRVQAPGGLLDLRGEKWTEAGEALGEEAKERAPGEGSCSVSRASIKVVGADETPPAGP